MELEEFNQIFGTNLEDEDHKTIGGFIIGFLGRIPSAGDKLVRDNIEFVIIEAGANKIDLIEVKRPKDSEELSLENTD